VVRKWFATNKMTFTFILLGSEGRAIIEVNGQLSFVPAITNDTSKLPEQLRKYVIEAD
jgi:hypothetical protein